MKTTLALFTVLTAFIVAGCTTPDRRVSDLRLGMTYDEVEEAMGRPFAVRASKVFEGEEWMDVWEYRPPVFSLAAVTEKYDRIYWVFFENGKVVQWGEPGDFSYDDTYDPERDELPVFEYRSQKTER